jgi:hypothetical protein
MAQRDSRSTTAYTALAASALPCLVEQAGIALAALDAGGRLCMMSPALADILGQPYLPCAAAELAETYHVYCEHGICKLAPEAVPLVRAWYGETVIDAYVVVKAPGSAARHLRINASPGYAADGSFTGALAVVEDVTDARAGSTTFAELRDRLVQGLNHELRTPLTTILGHSEMLEDYEADMSAPAADSLRAVRRAGKRLQAVANEVSTLADREIA